MWCNTLLTSVWFNEIFVCHQQSYFPGFFVINERSSSDTLWLDPCRNPIIKVRTRGLYIFLKPKNIMLQILCQIVIYHTRMSSCYILHALTVMVIIPMVGIGILWHQSPLVLLFASLTTFKHTKFLTCCKFVNFQTNCLDTECRFCNYNIKSPLLGNSLFCHHIGNRDIFNTKIAAFDYTII